MVKYLHVRIMLIMVGVAQWAERLSVEQVVEGSSTFAHPNEKPSARLAFFCYSNDIIHLNSRITHKTL